MRSAWGNLRLAVITTAFVLAITACGINNPAFLSDADSATVSISLIGPGTVALGGQSQYAATVTGGSDATVTWRVNGIAGGNSAVGSISAEGLYIAPSSAPQSSVVTITARSATSPAVFKSLPVALVAPAPPTHGGGITLSIAGATSLTLGTPSSYVAVVTGSSNTSVSWSVDGVPGGTTSDGLISATGLYTAPATAPRGSYATITATSDADSTVSESITVSLAVAASEKGGALPTALALSGATTITLGTSSQYEATVTGNSNTAVRWSVDGTTGGNATFGTISATGRYTASAGQLPSSRITITATSVADSSVSRSLIVVLVAPPAAPGGNGPGSTVTLALSGATTVALGASSQYTATVTGNSDRTVAWSVDGVSGGNTSVGTISTSGFYVAPRNLPQSPHVMITAASLADASVWQGLVITLSSQPQITLAVGGPTSVALDSFSQYTAVVSGSSNTGVSWSVNGVVGGNATDGVISMAGLYTAPSMAPQRAAVTITATSSADPTVAQSIVTSLIAPAGNSRIPANAIKSAELNASRNWQWKHDPGTPGTSTGASSYPVRGFSGDDAAREFYMTFTSGGGEIYHVSFAKDTVSTHFVYDANVYVVDPSQLKNLEMDMNAVMTNGQTVILATQCSGYSKSWEYTLRSSTGGYHWNPSNIPCNPQQWTANTWHHIQIASHRDNSGNAYYDWIGFDGKYTDFQNASGPNGKDLGWAVGSLLINFQIDGPSKSNGSNTLYTDKLFVWRW
jgi:hypothetical protein